jgi:hypothetical protein
MCVLDRWLLTRGPVIVPDPGVERVFLHATVTGGLGQGLRRRDGPFDRARLQVSGILSDRGKTHRTHLARGTSVLVSVCPEEYSHFSTLTKVEREQQLGERVHRRPHPMG